RADLDVQLVKGAERLDAGVVLRDPPSVQEARCPVVAPARRDAHCAAALAAFVRLASALTASSISDRTGLVILSMNRMPLRWSASCSTQRANRPVHSRTCGSPCWSWYLALTDTARSTLPRISGNERQ